jgi:hypothetical protein
MKKTVSTDDKNLKDKVPVLITTDSSKRGVFMGFIDPKDADKDVLEAEEVRMAVYWSTDVRGVIGLAAKGPTKNCKITSAAKKAVLKGVTATLEISDDALAAWRKEPWA